MNSWTKGKHIFLRIIHDLSPWSMIQPSNNAKFLPTVTDLQRKVTAREITNIRLLYNPFNSCFSDPLKRTDEWMTCSRA